MRLIDRKGRGNKRRFLVPSNRIRGPRFAGSRTEKRPPFLTSIGNYMILRYLQKVDR